MVVVWVYLMTSAEVCEVVVFIIIIIISSSNFVVIIITFMHGIYNYIHETNHFSRVYTTAAILRLQFLQYVI